MNIMRSALLRASENKWLAQHLPNYPFARQAVRRFMPGEHVSDALRECERLAQHDTATVITQLGENITTIAEAQAVHDHYVTVLSDIERRNLPTHVSIKPTQLGLDIDPDFCTQSINALVGHAGPDPLWIDMEGSRYTDVTIELFNRARATAPNAGLCIQAYLKRTAADLDALLASTTAIRLVKGAYKEDAAIAFARKADVDASYFRLARTLLERARHGSIGHAPAFATHDVALIRRINDEAARIGVPRDAYEFQMLYGINTALQQQLAAEGYRMRVLISYGAAWFAWYMRRLAERPANVLFLLKSLR